MIIDCFVNRLEFCLKKCHLYNMCMLPMMVPRLWICVNKYHIDIALLDVRMPVMDGLEAARMILKNHLKVKVIAMTFYAEKATILDMLRVGTHGVILKDFSDGITLERILIEVLNGATYMSNEVKQILNANLKNLQDPSLTNFTPREFDVLKLTCKGSTAKEIADALNLTSGSIENYRKELLRKSKTRNVAELVAFSIRNGIV
jgi:DNA-binding NarL/FixJ family response regulator